MLASNNGDPRQCAANLLKLTRGENPYDRIKGIDAAITDAPSASARYDAIAEAEWVLDTYEPRVEVEGINGIKIPGWVPGVGGMGFSIPNIPMLATGGFTEGITIAGEAGTEAVISFDRSVRAANIGYWEKAGEMLGVYDKSETALAGNLLSVDDFSLAELSQPSTTIVYDFSGFTWSPVIAGGKVTEDNDDLMQRLKAHEAEFFDWLERWIQTREVTAFA